MRIIAGRHRGRQLATPTGRALRPTSDRARQALFNILERGEPPIRGSRFLDLFAGTGAVGLEAFSRGAAEVLLVENAVPALSLIRANLARLGRPADVKIMAADAACLGPAPRPFDFVFLDPPYHCDLAAPALEGLRRGWLAGDARVVIELAASEDLALPEGYQLERERRYGTARFVFARAATR